MSIKKYKLNTKCPSVGRCSDRSFLERKKGNDGRRRRGRRGRRGGEEEEEGKGADNT